MPKPSTSRPEKLSDLERDIQISHERFRDQRAKRKLQKKELRKITTFFITANVIIGLVIAGMGALEHFYPSDHYIITEKVLIAAVGGVTLQSGAIILAAFKGLFSGKS